MQAWIVASARNVVKNDPSLRLGQAVFNLIYKRNPAVSLVGTEVDPFYDDSKIEAFLEAERKL